jgi:hypothetical protein
LQKIKAKARNSTEKSGYIELRQSNYGINEFKQKGFSLLKKARNNKLSVEFNVKFETQINYSMNLNDI